jgi:hypothetical protein
VLNEFDLLTLADVAKLLHCSKAHVGKAVRGLVQGCSAIPCVRLGRRKLVRRESLVHWIEQNESSSKIEALSEWGAGRRVRRKHAS